MRFGFCNVFVFPEGDRSGPKAWNKLLKLFMVDSPNYIQIINTLKMHFKEIFLKSG